MDKQLELSFTITKWQRDVDIETIDLIKIGIPPYEAAERAAKIVSNRRRQEHVNKSGG